MYIVYELFINESYIYVFVRLLSLRFSVYIVTAV